MLRICTTHHNGVQLRITTGRHASSDYYKVKSSTVKLDTHYPWVPKMTPAFAGRVGYTGDQHGP